MKSLIITCLLLFSSPVFAGDDVADSRLLVGEYHAIQFTNEAGQSAYIDFRGGIVTYSGDLPVAESARLFFDEFSYLCKEDK